MLLLKCYILSLWACLSQREIDTSFSKAGIQLFSFLSFNGQPTHAAGPKISYFKPHFLSNANEHKAFFSLTVTRAVADINAADAGLQGEGLQGSVLSWGITCRPCLWCSYSCTSPAPSGVITSCLAGRDLWVLGSLSFCGSLPCWSLSEWWYGCVSICPIENNENVYIVCQHAVRPSHVAVKSGSFKGSVLQTLLWLDSCFYCYSDEIMPSHE